MSTVSYFELRTKIGPLMITLAEISGRGYSCMAVPPSMKCVIMFGGFSHEHLQQRNLTIDWRIGRPNCYIQQFATYSNIGCQTQAIPIFPINAIQSPIGGNSCTADDARLFVFGGFYLTTLENVDPSVI